MPVTDYTEKDLVERAIMNAHPRECGESERWVAVMDTFGLGSTYARELCVLHGLNPDDKVSGARCLACNP
jgi:hypothetical protein